MLYTVNILTVNILTKELDNITSISKSDFLHALFVLKSLLGTEFGNSGKQNHPTLSMPEYILMKEAEESVNGCADLTMVREYLAVSKAAISQMLSSLEKRGLIIRKIDSKNRRNLVLILTEAGKVALQEKSADVEYRISEIKCAMGESETAQFAELIEKLNDAVRVSSENGRSL